MLNVALAIVCLVIAAVILVEPFLSGGLQERTKAIRCSVAWKLFRGAQLLAAFILGLTAGLDMLAKDLPTFSWLINAMAFFGFVIIIAIALHMIGLLVGAVSAIKEGR